MTTLTTIQARPYAGDADLPAITALLNLCDTVDQLDDSYTEDDLRLEFDSPDLNTAKDLRLWEDAAGRLVGFGQLWIPKEGEKVDGGLYLRVHPDTRDQHLEEDILAWGEARVREAAQEQGKAAQIRCWVREGNVCRPRPGAARAANRALLLQDGAPARSAAAGAGTARRLPRD